MLCTTESGHGESLSSVKELILTTISRLIRAVSAVIFSITLPPERNALIILADKLWSEKEREKYKQLEDCDS